MTAYADAVLPYVFHSVAGQSGYPVLEIWGEHFGALKGAVDILKRGGSVQVAPSVARELIRSYTTSIVRHGCEWSPADTRGRKSTQIDLSEPIPDYLDYLCRNGLKDVTVDMPDVEVNPDDF